MPLWINDTVSAPIAPPVMVPTPPQVGVPPTKTEAIAGSRYPSPVVGRQV